jgi:hypothetical protein
MLPGKGAYDKQDEVHPANQNTKTHPENTTNLHFWGEEFSDSKGRNQ